MYFDDKPIHIYNDDDFENDMHRDFTYVDDIIEEIIKLIDALPYRLKKQKRKQHIPFTISETVSH